MYKRQPKDQRLSPLPRDSYENVSLHDENDEQYGPLPEQAEEEEEEEQAGRRTKNSRRSRGRRLVGDDTGEPAVEHPLTCVSEGDSVLFDISSGCYPLYEKDSLLNSNLE